jgi:hypothetical protein
MLGATSVGIPRDEVVADLTGEHPGRATRTIRRLGQPMALNNTADTVMLVAPNTGIIQQITYQTVAAGQTHIAPPGALNPEQVATLVAATGRPRLESKRNASCSP